MAKALLLLSGGLDSTPAGKILLEAGLYGEEIRFSFAFPLTSMAAAAATITPNITN